MGPFIYDISGGRGNGPSKVDKERDSGMKARTKCRLDWREIGEVHLLNPFEKWYHTKVTCPEWPPSAMHILSGPLPAISHISVQPQHFKAPYPESPPSCLPFKAERRGHERWANKMWGQRGLGVVRKWCRQRKGRERGYPNYDREKGGSVVFIVSIWYWQGGQKSKQLADIICEWSLGRQ